MDAMMQQSGWCGTDLLWDQMKAGRVRQIILEATGSVCCTDDTACMWASSPGWETRPLGTSGPRVRN